MAYKVFISHSTRDRGLVIALSNLLAKFGSIGTDPRDLAALQGKEYIEYDPLQPQQALLGASTHVKSLHLK